MKRKRLMQMIGLAACFVVHFYLSGQIPPGWNIVSKAAAQVKSFTTPVKEKSACNHSSACIQACNRQP